MSRKLRKIKYQYSMNEKKRQPITTASPVFEESLDDNLLKIKKSFDNDCDLVIRKLSINQFEHKKEMALIYIEGIADCNVIEESVIVAIRDEYRNKECFEELMDLSNIIECISTSDIKKINEYEDAYAILFNGNTLLLVDGINEALAIDTKNYKERSIQESETEVLVRGPRDSFTEVIRTNTALVRQRIRSINLRVVSMEIGRATKTEIAVMYLDNITEPELVKEVFRRLEKINIDSILESGYIEELIQDETFTPFPTISSTERPDSVSGKLLEGRVAILVNGTPFALVVPALFTEFYQVPEDYYQRSDYITLIRILRLLAVLLSLLAPSFYIAITTFHHEMLPPTLLVSLYSQREGVPFPAFVEALIMEIAFEIIREAGLRMPRAVGQAVSIVGTLVVGLAAVEAGLVSAAMVIIVAITAISSFVIPSFNMGASFRILRFPMMALAASFGLYGISIGCILIVLHLCSLRSFGIPYMSPFAPFNLADQKDNILRLPLWDMIARPKLMNHQNVKREKENEKEVKSL
ncbi:spore germination protein [Alkalihalobacillus sp. 1P02AB]